MPFNIVTTMDTIEQSQVEPIFHYFLMRELFQTTLADPAIVDTSSLTTVAGTTITPDIYHYVLIHDDNYSEQAQLLTHSGVTTTIAMPLSRTYAAGSTVVIGSINMAVDGSVTPIEFNYMPIGQNALDIANIYVQMYHTGDGDDGMFGDIAGGLTNGMYARRSNSIIQNLGNYRTNGDFKLHGASVARTDRAPSGGFSTDIMFDLRSVYTKEQRYVLKDNDKFSVTVRDNIILTAMICSLYGSHTTGE